MSRQETAGIIHADITDSSRFAQLHTPEVYNQVIRDFQTLAFNCIQPYRKTAGLRSRFYAGGYGDDIEAVIRERNQGDSALHALRMAILLKQTWDQSDLGKQLKLLGQSQYGLQVNLSIGIGHGKVFMEKNAWSNNPRPEGRWILLTKVIQELSQKYAPDSLILATAEIKEAAQMAKLAIMFGESITLTPDKSYSLKLPDGKSPDLYPVLSYPQLAA